MIEFVIRGLFGERGVTEKGADFKCIREGPNELPSHYKT